MSLNSSMSITPHHTMSLIKQWIIDQERKMDEDLMFIDADRQHYIEQAMREEMEEPTIPSDIDPDYENFISNHPDGIYPPAN